MDSKLPCLFGHHTYSKRISHINYSYINGSKSWNIPMYVCKICKRSTYYSYDDYMGYTIEEWFDFDRYIKRTNVEKLYIIHYKNTRGVEVYYE
jgi:hypothetical protein